MFVCKLQDRHPRAVICAWSVVVVANAILFRALVLLACTMLRSSLSQAIRLVKDHRAFRVFHDKQLARAITQLNDLEDQKGQRTPYLYGLEEHVQALKRNSGFTIWILLAKWAGYTPVRPRREEPRLRKHMQLSSPELILATRKSSQKLSLPNEMYVACRTAFRKCFDWSSHLPTECKWCLEKKAVP